VVTAGFIDLHSHVNDLGGLRLQAMDGVSTALELEAGVTPVAEAYRRAAAQGRPVNYGFAASWALARMEAVAGLPPDASLGAFMARISDPAWQRPAEPAQVTALLARLCVRPGDDHRPGQLSAQHPTVPRDPACPGQRHFRGARRHPRGRRPAGAPGPRRLALGPAERPDLSITCFERS
jgi:hypothetical protein